MKPARAGLSDRVICRALERACDRGLIMYGAWIRRAWLTETGEALVEEPTSCQ